MTTKKFKVVKSIRINKNYTIPKGATLELDDSGMDGVFWKNLDDGSRGCPFFEFDSVREISHLEGDEE